MIKNSTYIRGFTMEQRKNLFRVQEDRGFKTVPEILFFCLSEYLNQKSEIDRLKRIINYKQKKIECLENEKL